MPVKAAAPGERWFALVLLVFSVTAFWQSYAISGFTGLSTAGIFPMLASAAMVCAASFILAGIPSLQKGGVFESRQSPGNVQYILPQRIVVLIALITVYVFLMPILGFLVASGLFLFTAFAYLWHKSILISLALTIFSLASVYLIFRKLFQVVLPEGMLFQGGY